MHAHATTGVATQMSTIISSNMMDPVPKNGRTAERLVMPLLNAEDHNRSPVQPNTKLSQINTTGILRMYPATMTDNTLTTFWGNAKVTDRSESTRAGPIRQSDCVVIHSKRYKTFATWLGGCAIGSPSQTRNTKTEVVEMSAQTIPRTANCCGLSKALVFAASMTRLPRFQTRCGACVSTLRFYCGGSKTMG